jgi:HAD superfamily hydrolase (TIGR01509 family)
VHTLHQRGVPLAIASSSAHQLIVETLRACGLEGAFSVVAGGDEVARGKPAPDIYLLAAERLGVSPEKCIAVEDAPAGVASARAAGMRVVAVSTPHTPRHLLGAADAVLPSLADVTPEALGILLA